MPAQEDHHPTCDLKKKGKKRKRKREIQIRLLTPPQEHHHHTSDLEKKSSNEKNTAKPSPVQRSKICIINFWIENDLPPFELLRKLIRFDTATRPLCSRWKKRNLQMSFTIVPCKTTCIVSPDIPEDKLN